MIMTKTNTMFLGTNNYSMTFKDKIILTNRQFTLGN